MANTVVWAPIVHARTAWLDFRLLAQPNAEGYHQFTDADVNWVTDHILATTYPFQFLGYEEPIYAVLSNDQYVVAGVGCMAASLSTTHIRHFRRENGKVVDGRELYLFAGYVAKRDRQKTPIITGPSLQATDYGDLYKDIVITRWNEETRTPDWTVATKTDYGKRFNPLQTPQAHAFNMDRQRIIAHPPSVRNKLWSAAIASTDNVSVIFTDIQPERFLIGKPFRDAVGAVSAEMEIPNHPARAQVLTVPDIQAESESAADSFPVRSMRRSDNDSSEKVSMPGKVSRQGAAVEPLSDSPAAIEERSTKYKQQNEAEDRRRGNIKALFGFAALAAAALIGGAVAMRNGQP